MLTFKYLIQYTSTIYNNLKIFDEIWNLFICFLLLSTKKQSSLILSLRFFKDAFQKVNNPSFNFKIFNFLKVN